jgi:hypothetical protein
VVVDLVKAWDPPLDPLEIVAQIVEICKQYGLTAITGDRYSAEWSKTAFEREGLRYETAELSKSDAYLNLEPVINTGKVTIPNNERLLNELRSLERRTGRNRDIIDHPPQRGSKDDLANAVALVSFSLVDAFEGQGEVSIKLSSTLEQFGVADLATARDLGLTLKSGGDW